MKFSLPPLFWIAAMALGGVPGGCGSLDNYDTGSKVSNTCGQSYNSVLYSSLIILIIFSIFNLVPQEEEKVWEGIPRGKFRVAEDNVKSIRAKEESLHKKEKSSKKEILHGRNSILGSPFYDAEIKPIKELWKKKRAWVGLQMGW